MLRNRISAIVTEKALALANDSSMQSVIDAYADGTDVSALRQVCAKVSPALAEDLDSVTSRLGMSKRLFVESAIIDALAQAKRILQEELGSQDSETDGEAAA